MRLPRRTLLAAAGLAAAPFAARAQGTDPRLGERGIGNPRRGRLGAFPPANPAFPGGREAFWFKEPPGGNGLDELSDVHRVPKKLDDLLILGIRRHAKLCKARVLAIEMKIIDLRGNGLLAPFVAADKVPCEVAAIEGLAVLNPELP